MKMPWFLLGLVAFLIGHLFFIGAFVSISFKGPPRRFSYLLILFATCVAVPSVMGLDMQKQFKLAIGIPLYTAVIVMQTNRSFGLWWHASPEDKNFT